MHFARAICDDLAACMHLVALSLSVPREQIPMLQCEKTEVNMRGERGLLLSGAATILVMTMSLSGGTALGATDSASLLSARSMTEEQYLERMVPIFKELYGPMAVPAAKLIWHNAGPVFAMDAMTRCYGEIWALKGPLGVTERMGTTGRQTGGEA